MAKNLVIVESPAKAKTINKFIGKDFDVVASMGHVRDLPSSKMGVDVEHDFTPQYLVIKERRQTVKALQAAAKGKAAVYLAPDPDREGEAISWHLAHVLLHPDAAKPPRKKKTTTPAAAKPAPKPSAKPGDGAAPKIFRVAFNEITPEAVREAFAHPTTIDEKKVNAQQARRILDRLVGYSLSPLLWRKVGRGLSAGRVQSVALKLIVDREKEIEAFVPQEYWTIEADLTKQEDDQKFTATLEKIGDKPAEPRTKDAADALVAELQQQSLSVASVERKDRKRRPQAPFTTSKLQQEAYNKLRFTSAKTMRIAQQLYEGLEIGDEGPTGLITYMRTDSVRMADVAMQKLRGYIHKAYGKEYLADPPNLYKSKKAAQEAHEAIRPTDFTRAPETIKRYLDDDQLKLYQLIWSKAVASQMSDAQVETTTVRIQAGRLQLKVTGSVITFQGFLAAYPETEEDDSGRVLPPLATGDALRLLDCRGEQHFTKPPPRFTDASLVKALEEDGIGRPSTYAPILQILLSRDYVRRVGGGLQPSDLGKIVVTLLVEHFPHIVDEAFTAAMEEHLDKIEEGEAEWVQVLRGFYQPFSEWLAKAHDQMRNVKRETLPTNEVCEQCGKPMVIKWGRFGQFMSCSAFPACKNAKPIPTGVQCPQPQCGGQLVRRKSQRGFFYGCSNYPTCEFTSRKLPSPEATTTEPGEQSEIPPRELPEL